MKEITRKQLVFGLVDENNTAKHINRGFNGFIIGLILLNVLAIILESFHELAATYQRAFAAFEVFSVGVFTVEYLMRIYTADLKYPDKTKAMALLAFVFSPLALIDLMAILPAYLPLLIPVDLRFLRILRLLRVTRIFKINRYSKSLKLISDVLREKRADLSMTFFVAFIILVLAASIMYNVEGQAQPEAFPNIVASFWWAIATLTTVGYGDVVPITVWGKIISSFVALLGIGIVALPTGIIGAAFVEKIREHKKQTENGHCPTCGQPINKGHEGHS